MKTSGRRFAMAAESVERAEIGCHTFAERNVLDGLQLVFQARQCGCVCFLPRTKSASCVGARWLLGKLAGHLHDRA
jgi:hypothetical protein